MIAHTAQFDETRFTVDDEYPVTLQHFFSEADWRTFLQEVNRHGEAYQSRRAEIIKQSHPGWWCCCICLFCVCGPCILMYKMSQIAEDSKRRMTDAKHDFEKSVQQTCEAWQERCGRLIRITLKFEKAQRIEEGNSAADEYPTTVTITYRKYWLGFSAVEPPLGTVMTASLA